MMILRLKLIGCNYSKHAPPFVFQYLKHFSTSCRKIMGPNELKNLIAFVEVKHIFILRIQLFYHISCHPFGALKNSIFVTLIHQKHMFIRKCIKNDSNSNNINNEKTTK